MWGYIYLSISLNSALIFPAYHLPVFCRSDTYSSALPFSGIRVNVTSPQLIINIVYIFPSSASSEKLGWLCRSGPCLVKDKPNRERTWAPSASSLHFSILWSVPSESVHPWFPQIHLHCVATRSGNYRYGLMFCYQWIVWWNLASA